MTLAKFEEQAQRYALPVGALTALLAAVGLAIADKTASAAVMAGLFAVTILFIHFPNLESFKAWGVEAKMMRKVLDEAKASLEHFRSLVALSSQQTFWALSKQGRWGDNDDVIERNRLAIATTALLKETGVDSARIKEAQKYYIQMMRFDFGATMRQAMNSVIRKDWSEISSKSSDLSRRLLRGEDVGNENDIVANQLIHMDKMLEKVTNAGTTLEDQASLLQDALFRQNLDERDAVTLDRIYSEIQKLCEASCELGFFTQDAEYFLRTYGTSVASGAQMLLSKFRA